MINVLSNAFLPFYLFSLHLHICHTVWCLSTRHQLTAIPAEFDSTHPRYLNWTLQLCHIAEAIPHITSNYVYCVL